MVATICALVSLTSSNLVSEPLFKPWIRTTRGPVFLGEISAREAIRWWLARRATVAKTKLWPVILGDADALRIITEPIAHQPIDVASILKASKKVDLRGFLARRLRDSLPDPREEAESVGIRKLDFDPRLLKRQKKPPFEQAIVETSRKKTVKIALAPTRSGDEVPAFFAFGDFNSCPKAAEHVAVLRDWNRRYGAELVVLSGDTIELRVRRPLNSPLEAKKVAREQYAYASDIVDQGTNDLPTLAEAILGANTWFFWWD